MRRAVALLALFVSVVSAPSRARADADGPSLQVPRDRPCCALAMDMRIHFASAHVPAILRGVISREGLGRHAYLAEGVLTENNGFLYTRRGGFIDVAHTRDNADVAAYLAHRLGPLLARGEGTIAIGPKGADRIVRVTRAVPARSLARTRDAIAIRAAFAFSVWTELVQYYGLAKYRGAEEVFSSFTPDDLYSNLLGAHLGVTALASALPYDRAMDVAIAAALDRLGAVTEAESRAIFADLDGVWWSSRWAWPAPDMAVHRNYALGPRLSPELAPSAPAAGSAPEDLDLPQSDDEGVPLSDYFAVEIRPHREELVRFPREVQAEAVGEEDLPHLVDGVRRALEAAAYERDDEQTEPGIRGAVGHYLNGLRAFELSAAAGARSTGAPIEGAGGGGLVIFRGDTRGGDLRLLGLDVLHAPERGPMAQVSFFRSDALWFCRDPETKALRAPLLSVLGPCAPGAWIGVGGAIGEAMHDGATGRTMLRPVRLDGVLNPLQNGQSASYDAFRVLVRAGGEIEHVWSEAGGPRTLPRTGATLSLLARSPSRRFEARAAAGYRFDVLAPRDGAFESDLALAYNFLLGGTAAPPPHERLDPFAVAAIGLRASYSVWARPENAYPEIAAPFVSATRPSTFQLLVTTTFGLTSIAF